jgi:DNA-binding transcriptional regulator PaaX
MLTFLGDYLYDRDLCVFSGSVIDVLGRLGVSEHATRSTLTRMVNRGLLYRQKDGRRMYFGLTEHADPEKIEPDLMALLPKKEWTAFTHRVIYHGRETCIARKPECEVCVVNELCPSAEEGS